MRAASGLFLLVLASLACQDKASEALPPSFVRIQFINLGSLPGSWAGSTLYEAEILFDGCELYSADNKHVVYYQGQSDRIYNLHEGNVGCTPHLESFWFGPPGDSDFFYRVDTEESETIDASAGEAEPAKFIGEQSGRVILAFPGQGLASELRRFEKISFYLLPAYEESEVIADYRMLDHPELDESQIGLIFHEIKDNGDLAEGGRGLKVSLSCVSVRMFRSCRGVSLLDYRFQLAPLPTGEYDGSLLRGLTTASSSLVRPTVKHIKGNGLEFHLVAPKHLDGDIALDVLLIIKLGHDYRTFELNLRDVLEYL